MKLLDLIYKLNPSHQTHMRPNSRHLKHAGIFSLTLGRFGVSARKENTSDGDEPQLQDLSNSLNFRPDHRKQLKLFIYLSSFLKVCYRDKPFTKKVYSIYKRRNFTFTEQQPAFSKHMVSKCPFGNSIRSPGAGTHIHLIKTDLQVKISYGLECRSFSVDTTEHEVLPRCAYRNKTHTCRNNHQLIHYGFPLMWSY